MSKRGIITSEELEREYLRCIEREQDRYRGWAKTRQGAFETYQVLHFDFEAEESLDREQSVSWITDRGKGAAAIRRFGKAHADLWRRREAAAIKQVRRKAPHLLPVLRLIIRNGPNRQKSIAELMENRDTKKIFYHRAKTLYFRHRNALLRLFGIAFSCI